ncbi:scavenger receptor cysteine-rich domain-containing group B protein-like [Callorhinchus milii]|uniref:scavenger receptor cysteine-rich domain-containing group B protein-like n=1 Tax=Callorhinchus milii TaxID=7868 RepID=UPI001C3FF22A|nr:scavenger receptor cysteine-rich domain-containing group B protein-like [Callorhinchus milii]
MEIKFKGMLLVMLVADQLRLANGVSPCAGRVEIYHDGQWGTVYGYGSGGRGWDMKAVAVVCKELGCGAALSASADAHFGEGSGPIVTYYVQCRGTESTLRACESQTWGHYSMWYSHSYDAGVICSDRLRLVNDDNPCAGRVEVFYDGQWGTVVGSGSGGSGWDMADAAVVCKELGCGAALSASGVAHFGRGSGPVVTYNVQCKGSESALKECPSGSWGHYSWLSHSYDTGVICTGKRWHLRLESGGSRCDGRVEIYHDGTWGRLLDDSWNVSDADVICRQLNCGSVISIYNFSQYGEGTGPVWINNVQCVGTETHIWNCPLSTVASPSRSSSDVGVLCSDHKQLRLVDGGSSCSGTVEIYRNGNWSRVQDQFWDLYDANVVCRQLACGAAITAYSSPSYREDKRSRWLKDVQCQGSESHILKCKPSRLNQSIRNMSDVGVQCSSE